MSAATRPTKVALRRAIGLAIDVDQEIRLLLARPGGSRAVGADAEYRRIMTQASSATRHSMTLPRAKVPARPVRLCRSRWRRLARATGWFTAGARMGHDPGPTRASARRTAPQGHERDRHPGRTSGPAKWPENLKNARAGKLMVWNLGYSAASPDGRAIVRSRRDQSQWRSEPRTLHQQAFDEIYRAHHGTCPTARSANNCSSKASACWPSTRRTGITYIAS